MIDDLSQDDCLTNLPLFQGRPLRVLFLSSDTGGGHRASAKALGEQVSQTRNLVSSVLSG